MKVLINQIKNPNSILWMAIAFVLFMTPAWLFLAWLLGV